MILLGILLLGLAGCSDKDSKQPSASDASVKAVVKKTASKSKRLASATNRVTMAEAFPGATSNELLHITACLNALDEGRDAFAMRHARELMGSTNVVVRFQAVEVFGWIGRIAINELAEMMADADEDVSFGAQHQWEMAFDEISSTVGKMQAIERTALALKRQESLEAVMMKLISLEDSNAIKVLSNIITSPDASSVAIEVAREEYASLAAEPFVDANRAAQVAKALKDQEEGLTPEPLKRQSSKILKRKATK